MNGTRSRIRREFFRENSIKDRDHFNLYGTNDDDGKFFRTQPSDDLNEQKRFFDGEYYLSPKNQFRISTKTNISILLGNCFFLGDLNELYDEDFIHGNRLSNEMNDYYHPLWKKDRTRFGGKKSFENDFLDKQD